MIPVGNGELELVHGESFGYFRSLRPTAYAGYSIWIYHINAEQCDRIQRDLETPIHDKK